MDSKMQTKKKKGWKMGRLLSGMMLMAMCWILLIPQAGIKVQAANPEYIDTIRVNINIDPEETARYGNPTTVPTVTVSDDGPMTFFNANGGCILAHWDKYVNSFFRKGYFETTETEFGEGSYELFLQFRLYDDDNKFNGYTYDFAEHVTVYVNGREWEMSSKGLLRNEDEGYTYFHAHSPEYILKKTYTGTGFSYDTQTRVMTLSGNVDKDELYYFEKKNDVLSIVAEAGTVLPPDCRDMFRNYSYCTSIDLSNVNSSSVTKTSYMFNGCSRLISLDIRGLDMRHVTSYDYMFGDCSKLTSLCLGYNFSNVASIMNLKNGENGWSRGNSNSRISGTDGNAVFSNSGTNWYHRITSIAGEVKIEGTGEIGNTLKATVSGSNTTNFKYQWKRGDEDISGATSASYKIVKADAGKRLYCEITGADIWIGGYIQNSEGIKVDKMAGPAKPTGLTYEAPSKKGRTDAVIYGVNDKMEYSKYTDFSNSNSITTDAVRITDLGAGTYYIRVKETDTTKAGAYATVKIPEGQTACYTFSKGVMTLQGKVDRTDIRDFDKKSEVKSIVASKGTILPESCSELFCGFDQCTKVDLSNANTGKVTNMYEMFDRCSALKTIDLSGFDTSNVNSFSYMFYNCTSLTKLNLSHFDTSNVTNMSYMFAGCEALSSLNINNFKTDKVTNMYYMFNGCKSLKSLNLAGFDLSQVTESSGMFSNCESLSTLTLGAKFGNVTSTMNLPNGGFGWGKTKDAKTSISGTSSYAEITNTKKTTYYKIAQISGTVSISGKTIYKQTLTANVTDSNATNFKYQWMRGGNDITNATGKTYKLTVQDIGYSITCVVRDADGKYPGFIQATETDTIAKLAGPKAPTGLTAGAPTKLGRSDGVIYGVTDKMEYSGYSDFSSSKSVYSGNDTIESLSAGVYYVRIKETDTTKAGAAVKVTVPQGQDACYTYSKGVLTLKGRVNCDDIKSLDVKDKVKSIIASEGTKLPASCYCMFNNYVNCTKIDLSKADTSSVRDMESMFANCTSLKTLNLNTFDTSKVTSMNSMFNNCQSLTKLTIDNFDTSNVTNMRYMFNNCTSLTSLNLSSFTLGANTETYCMFCYTNMKYLTLGAKFGNITSSMDLRNGEYGWVKGKTGTKRISGDNYAAEIKNTAKTTYYKVNTLSGNVVINGTPKVKQVLKAVVSEANTDQLTYQWKRNDTDITGATEATYKLTKNDVDMYITCAVSSSSNLYGGSIISGRTSTVVKADAPAAPKGLKGVAPSKMGASDGKITGVKTTMEYSTNIYFENGNTFACTSDTITGLSAGTYYVRVKETASAYAGQATEVVVEEGPEKPEPGPNPSGVVTDVFKDVKEGQWYVNAVQFVYDKKIMNGTSDNTFGPMMTMTRGQFVTILYNMEGRPEIKFMGKFTDVKSTDYFALPVEWAAKVGISDGTGGGKFSPNAVITREQLAVMFYKYAQYKGYKTKINSKALDKYPDVKKIDTWALDAMKWAVTNGVMSGKSTTSGKDILDPLGKATRAECAQMVKNLFDKAMK